jgi:radical SAM protein with 4Fe4S-binding SPASM domain
VNFKPVVRESPASLKGIIPLIPVGKGNQALNGTCMTSAGAGGGATCDNCDFLDDKMAFLREETKRHGFPTPDGVHNGPCHVHKTNAHTIGPDGSLYACPGFTGQKAQSTGHIDNRKDSWRDSSRRDFDRLAPWKECGDCAFIPVCAGGCVAASQSQLGDMNLPTCHKRSYESALVSLAHTAASAW